MSNIKISELPEFTGSVAGSWLVMDNSTQTTTYKVLRENIVSTTSGTSGSSGYNGTGGSSGTSGTSGSGTSGTSGFSLFNLTGSIWNTTNNIGITGSFYTSKDIIVNNTMNIGLGGGNIDTNIAIGPNALVSNISGSGNIAIGSGSLSYFNTTGESLNTAIGFNTLNVLTSGSSFNINNVSRNTMVGGYAGYSLVSGSRNTAVGGEAMINANNTERNTALGRGTLINLGTLYGSGSKYNTVIGHNAARDLISGSNNILLMGGSF
mgnify:CR=1 FL=1